MATFAIEVSQESVLDSLQREIALPTIRQVPNVSQILNSLIFVVETIVPMLKLPQVPGLIYQEGSLEHVFYNGFDPIPVNDLRSQMPMGTSYLSIGPDSNQNSWEDSFSSILDWVKAPQAWRANQGEGCVVLVLDSGIDDSIVPDAQKAGGWSWDNSNPWEDSYGHGSLIARSILAVAPRASIYSVKPEVGPAGGIMSVGAILALDHLLGVNTRGARLVANNSWGVYGCTKMSEICDVLPVRLVMAIDKKGGPLTTWAAGNNRQDCGFAGVVNCINSIATSLSVAAVDQQGWVQPYSAYGPGQCYPFHPSVAAPTYGVLPWGRGYVDFGPLGGGTSASTAIASGALAILSTAFPRESNSKLRARLKLGASPLWNPITGHGVLNIERSLGLDRRLMVFVEAGETLVPSRITH